MATSKSNPQISLRVPPEVLAEIAEYMKDLSPVARTKVDAASLRDNGAPHESDVQAFMAFAIRTALKRTPNSMPRQFGNKIDEFVDGIMKRNLEAYESNPENWWELTAIGSSVLRDGGHNPISVKRWMEENAERLAAHHAAVGITDPASHNRKAGKARKAMSE